jgi:2-polyprenyl-6-hydroxyphenyl methylase/3-demethylubiquinone-9 3-methyltransferase
MQMTASTVDPDEIAHFSRMAEEWWDEHGKFRPLHQMNPTRIAYLRERICLHYGIEGGSLAPFKDLSLLDIGCGGGLISEPFARLGAQVTGIDASARNIEVASLHARKMGLSIDYRATQPETLLETETPPSYDVVLALEIIEHVADRAAFVQACARLLKPGGILFVSTLNRTLKSWALAILGAEYVLRWLPRGTHDWHKFVTPAELTEELRACDLRVSHMTGLVYHPLRRSWRVEERDVDVNYIVAVIR